MELDTVVLAEHGITDDDTGPSDKAGGRNGGFETSKWADHASIVGESARDL